jgi:GxxExxY protein
MVSGAAKNGYNTLEDGFLEPIYQEVLEIEFEERQFPFVSQKETNLSNKDDFLKKR